MPDHYMGALPFLSQYSAGLGRLYDETLRSQAPAQDVNAARDIARREAALRGIGGPLAAGLVGGATSNIISDFGRRRTAELSQILEMMRMAANDEARRRADVFAQRQAAAQANREGGEGWGRAIGGIGGGLLGALLGLPLAIPTGGASLALIPAGASAGYGIGGAVGGNLADWTYGGPR